MVDLLYCYVCSLGGNGASAKRVGRGPSDRSTGDLSATTAGNNGSLGHQTVGCSRCAAGARYRTRSSLYSAFVFGKFLLFSSEDKFSEFFIVSMKTIENPVKGDLERLSSCTSLLFHYSVGTVVQSPIYIYK